MKKIHLFLSSWKLFPAGMNEFRVCVCSRYFMGWKGKWSTVKEDWSALGSVCSWQHLALGAFSNMFHCLGKNELQSFSSFTGEQRLNKHHNILEGSPGRKADLWSTVKDVIFIVKGWRKHWISLIKKCAVFLPWKIVYLHKVFILWLLLVTESVMAMIIKNWKYLPFRVNEALNFTHWRKGDISICWKHVGFFLKTLQHP